MSESFDMLSFRPGGLQVRPSEQELRDFFGSRCWLAFMREFSMAYNRHLAVASMPEQTDRVTHMALGAADTIKAFLFSFPKQLVSVSGKETSENRINAEEEIRQQMRRIINGYFERRENGGNDAEG